jgi:oligoribonuclease (3'-5' exoribonuclease)
MKNHLIFIDLETGGLNGRLLNGELGSEYLPILEVAVIVTDTELNEVGTFHYVVSQSDEMLNRCDHYARNMHEKTGLLQRVIDQRKVVNSDLSSIEDKLIEDLSSIGVQQYNRKAKSGGIICGSSVAFDRSFMMAQTPKLNDYFHYRQIDVSSLALLCRMWKPELEEQAIAHKKLEHKALPDIRETIAELRVYKEFFFK